MEEQFYLDEPCVISFFYGELGWFLQRWQGYLRYLKQKVYPDHKFVVFCNPKLHVFVDDFAYCTIDFPKEFYDLGLSQDCYEAVPPDAPAGSLTPPNVYSDLIGWMRKHYNREKAVEVWPPRGFNLWIDSHPQIFCNYIAEDKVKADKPIIVVMPRKRGRGDFRNVPEYIWREVVDNLKKDFLVVLGGTPGGSALADYKDDSVVDLINYNEEDKTEQLITYLSSAVCSLTSQSGTTHISLFVGCPSYVIGHEEERHTKTENRLQTPTCFRRVEDYRAIDAETILEDISSFLDVLDKAGALNIDYSEDYDKILEEDSNLLEKFE